MTDTHVPSMGAAIRNGVDSLMLSERQASPDLVDAFKAAAAIVAGSVLLSFVGMGGMGFACLAGFGGAIVAFFMDVRRQVAIIAYPDYYLAIRSVPAKYRKADPWNLDETPGTIIAVLERAETLRPEERASPTALTGQAITRDLFVFHEGRVAILMTARMLEDESIEQLHRVRAFFARHGSNATPAAPEEGRAASPSTASAPRKGTLS